MDRAWVRSAAFGWAFACGALVAGPGVIATPVANAGLFGIGPDWLDIFGGDDHKSRQNHPRPGSEVSAQTSRGTAGGGAQPVAKIGSEPAAEAVPQSAARAAAPEAGSNAVASAEAPRSLGVGSAPESLGRGGGAIPRSSATGRASSLPPVPTAPVTRSIVIRGGHTPAPTAEPEFAPSAPVVVPLAAPPPAPEVPATRPAPTGPPVPTPVSPPAKSPGAPKDSGGTRIPDSFRTGYPDYLRTASTTDLFVAALPGVAGIAGFTLVGAYAGYRQARALQKALLAPVPTRVLL